jgi:hypothetical protein
MMGIARKNEACGTGHGCSYADADLKRTLNEKMGRGKCVCPRFFGERRSERRGNANLWTLSVVGANRVTQ